MELEKRIEQIRKTKEKFRLDNVLIAQYAKLQRVTVAKALSETQSDKRYLTDGNITAIEKAIEKILDEYRKDLCGEKKA